MNIVVISQEFHMLLFVCLRVHLKDHLSKCLLNIM